MRTQTRHRLKQDQFVASASEAVTWTVEHRDKLQYGGIALVVILALVFWKADVPDIKTEDDYHLDDAAAPGTHSIWSGP